MPGIFVGMGKDDLLEVTLPFFQPYMKRIRTVDGARWGGDDNPVWLVPIESAEDLDDAFEDELIYQMNREELLDLPPLPIPSTFKRVKKVPINDFKLPLRKFQHFGVNFLTHVLKKKGIALLGDLMGTGKTPSSIATALQLQQEGKVNKVLVVVLASTRRQWEQEIEKFSNETSTLFAEFKAKYKQKNGKRYIAESIEEQKNKMLDEFMQGDSMFMIVSYQALQQNAASFERVGFDMLIADEAHYMKNRESKTNKAAKTLVQKRTKRHKKGFNKGIEYVLFVSGTPIMNYPDEIYGLVSIAGEKTFGKWREFRKDFCILNEYKDIIGYQNLSVLKKKTQSFLIRRTDKEIGVDLPKMIEDDILIDPHPNQVKLDKFLMDELAQLMSQRNVTAAKAGNENAMKVEARLKGIKNQRIAGGCHPNTFQMAENKHTRDKFVKFKVKNEMDIPKFRRCLDIVEEATANGHKVVIFVNSRRMTEMLHKAISKFTRGVRYIGGLSDDVRDKRKKRFNEDPRCMVMIANSAGSTGLNLQGGRYLINYDLPHNPAEWNQRKYRIRRLDSTHDKIYIINLINRGLVDEEMRKKLDEKQASFDGTIENNSATTSFHQKMNVKPKKKRRPIKDDDILDFS